MIILRARGNGLLGKRIVAMGKAMKIPSKTLEAQFTASDPANSVWVSANAGSGKTHVLTQRVVRLMLAGNPPDKILCLTFTKAAAANMKNRVFDMLGTWTMMGDGDLAEAIRKSTGLLPSAKVLRRARQLFAEALDTPGGLKIQTIHAFCESLLHQFPLEANVSGRFEVLQDTGQAALLEEARIAVLTGRRGRQFNDVVARLIADVSDQSLDEAISSVISKRHRFRRWLEQAGGLERALDELAQTLDVPRDQTEDEIFGRVLGPVSEYHDEYLKRVRDLAAQHPGRTNNNLANSLSRYFENDDPAEKFEGLRSASLTAKNTLRAGGSIADKHVKDVLHETVDRIQLCGDLVLKALDPLYSLRLLRKSELLFNLADAVLSEYDRLKTRRGLIDYDDQIERCVNLLARKDISAWIRYRLDRGIDHVLVDEAQDTSPAQWQIIKAITDDFHSGESAAARVRTEFVVGDEKQSIYSFQGAEPKEFARQERLLERTVRRADKPYEKVQLALSFRSTPDVLRAVDAVFANEQTRKGLTQNDEPPVHDAIRNSEPGEVQVWPVYPKPTTPDPKNWLDPVDREGMQDPAVKLAERISRTIGDWVGKPLPGTGEALKFEDILVLVRRRDRFITALTRTMKDMGLAVAGADRLKLMEHIAIEDLVAIGKFILLPDDDLNLACVLKGFHFGLNEDELFALAHGRKEPTLFAHLEGLAKGADTKKAALAAAVLEKLNILLNKGQTLDVFDFYAWLLGAGQGRRQLLARLGMEAEDVIDAFVDEILSFQREGGVALEVFLAQLTKANPEIKRELELDRDEVRILTVHASKGLEAKVVFLVDPCNQAWDTKHRERVFQIGADDDERAPFVWVPTADDGTDLTREVLDAEKAAAEAEYRRLLYVGMTRAADRLVVCGYRGSREPKYDHWHSMVSAALVPDAEPIMDNSGEIIGHRWEADVPKKPVDPVVEEVEAEAPQTEALPNWLYEKAKPDPVFPRPLTPSGAFALIDRDMKSNRKPAFEREGFNGSQATSLGNAVHRVLEVLPSIAEADRREVSASYLQHVGRHWPSGAVEQACRMVSTVMQDDTLRFVFSDDGQSEVSVVGRLKTDIGERLITGQIDRLIVTDERVHIVDYKTNRYVPATVDEVQPEYIAQLALYRHVIQDIYQGRPVHCALLWTSAPLLMEIGEQKLHEALELIKKG